MSARDVYRVIRRKIRKVKYAWLNQRAANGSEFAKIMIHRKGHHLCELGLISDAAESTFPLAGPSPQTRIPPDFGTEDLSPETSTHPAINAYLLKDAIASAQTSLIVAKDKLLVTQELLEQRGRVEIDSGTVGYYTKQFAIRYSHKRDQHENAILIGGNGAFNWYHFVMEVAPKAYLAGRLPEQFKGFPLIVPKVAQTAGPFADILEALLPGRCILNETSDSAYVRNLVVFDEVSCGPFNLYPGLWPKMSEYSQHEDILTAVIAHLQSAFLQPSLPASGSRRIFIVRPDIRRNYNQQELVEIAGRYDFEPIAPEQFSLREQAQMYADASHVVGASGAAWTNMIFAPRPFKALTWILPQYKQFCSYSMLAHLLGHQLHYLTAVPEKKVNSTADAFVASYRVSPLEFEAALERIVGES
jgi:Glycosyltransferase 61